MFWFVGFVFVGLLFASPGVVCVCACVALLFWRLLVYFLRNFVHLIVYLLLLFVRVFASGLVGLLAVCVLCVGRMFTGVVYVCFDLLFLCLLV